jgi:hypothetical protein
MKYKPDESTLTSYLYGELSKDEQAKVKSYLDANPEVMDELKSIQSMQNIMGKLQDKEVAEPSFVFEDPAKIVVVQGSSGNFIKSILAIAASISLLILVGYFTQFQISNKENGWKLSFGQASEQTQASDAINEENLKNWMQETLAANNESLLNKISEVEDNFGSQTAQLRAVGSGTNQLANYKIDQGLIDQYVDQIAQENRDIILNLLEVSGRTQKQYMDELMTDFARYIESQRQSDLDVIQGHLNSLVNSSAVDQTDEFSHSE